MTEALAFETPQDWHGWLAANHASAKEIWVLYHRKGSGIPSIDWQQAVVEALVWGWIDGVRRTVSPTQWTQRFTPRKPGSSWSQINRAHAERLIAEGRMQPAGLAQVQIARENGRWDAAYSGAAPTELPQDFLDALAVAPEAARIAFQTINARSRYAIYYRLTTAKRPETRAKRLAGFIETLTRGEQIPDQSRSIRH